METTQRTVSIAMVMNDPVYIVSEVSVCRLLHMIMRRQNECAFVEVFIQSNNRPLEIDGEKHVVRELSCNAARTLCVSAPRNKEFSAGREATHPCLRLVIRLNDTCHPVQNHVLVALDTILELHQGVVVIRVTGRDDVALLQTS
jgi:hypothetical protein